MSTFLGVPVKKVRPTKAHRPAIWENMLGTVYAMSPAGEVRYFDLDHDGAKAFAELGEDNRLYKHDRWISFGPKGPRPGQLVLWTK